MGFTPHHSQSGLAAELTQETDSQKRDDAEDFWARRELQGYLWSYFLPSAFIPLWKLPTGLCWYPVLGTHCLLGSGGSFAYILLQEALCSQQSRTQF